MTFKKWMVGAALTGIMVTALGADALLFSARDFQYGLRDVVPNGLVQIDKLLAIDNQIEALQDQSSTPRGDLTAIDQQIATLDAEIGHQQQELNDARTRIAGGVAQVEANAHLQPVESVAANLDTGALSNRVNALASRSGLAPADQTQVAAMRGQVSSLATLDQSFQSNQSERAALFARRQSVAQQIDDQDRVIHGLQERVVPDYNTYQRVRGEVIALHALSPFGIAASLAQGHPALLSTALVLVMGALGAILYLFPAYLTRPQPVTFAEILVRLIFGMCAALAFYVLANATLAGFSIATDVQQATTASALNPFTVSLIGVIAGVLAEDLAKWIKDRSKGVLTQGGGAVAPDPAPAPEPQGAGVNPHGGPPPV